MSITIRAKRLLTRSGWRSDAGLKIENGTVVSLDEENCGIEAEYVVPGMTDVHLHGGFLCDVMQSGDWTAWLNNLAARGTTHILAGVYTDAPEAMQRALSTAQSMMKRQGEGLGGALVEGVHLEGPYINNLRAGAMKIDKIRAPSASDFDALFGGYFPILRIVTLAPEMEGAFALIEALVKRGIAVNIGHTDAQFEQAEAAFQKGVRGVSHCYNACRPINHREPGLIAAAMLNKNVFCECIFDGAHVHPAAAQLLYRMKGKERMLLVSDAVMTTGMKDGDYWDNGVKILVRAGQSRTGQGALNGGGETQLGEVMRLAECGVPLADAFHMACFTPDEYLGQAPREIVLGARADLAALDQNLHPILTVLKDTVYKGEEQPCSK